MSKRDYYEILGVSRTVTDVELKASYRKLAMLHHPDRNPGDNECEHKFKELNEAYDVLKDGDKRAAYDRFGHAAFEQGGGGSRHGFGADLRYDLDVTLEEAFRGVEKKISIANSASCEECKGSGAAAGGAGLGLGAGLGAGA